MDRNLIGGETTAGTIEIINRRVVGEEEINMAIKKSELYSSLWDSACGLRGSMDPSQYKDYVLVLLFIKYISEKARTDKTFLIDVPEGGGFKDMVALKNKTNIGEGINTIIKKLAEANANDLTGVIDVADFDDPDKLGKGKDMVDRLSNLIAILDFIYSTISLK